MTKSLTLSQTDAAFLDRVITAYLENRPFFYSFIRPQEALLFYRHRHLLQPPILDFGCGDGFFASLALPELKLDYGLDLPGTGLDTPHARLQYRQCISYGGSAIPLPDQSLNAVISNCVFEHVSDISLSFKEINRLLKPGGYFIASMLGSTWETNLWGGKLFGRAYLNWWRRLQVHDNVFSYVRWQKLYRAAGFDIKSAQGYLSFAATHRLEFAHYLSVPQFILARLTRRWSYPPYRLPSVQTGLVKAASNDLNTSMDQASCYFIVAQKPLHPSRK